MKYLYIFVQNKHLENVIKYGMKLSEFSNKLLTLSDVQKCGITAFLSPKDSELYYETDFSCVKVLTNNINGLIYNKTCDNSHLLNDFICDISKYEVGHFEEPVAFITSTILPENIQVYNKLQDVPLLIENSKQFYYEKAIHDMLENDKFSKYELYQMLLILGEQKKIYQTTIDKNIKIYEDKISGKKYTKRSSF